MVRSVRALLTDESGVTAIEYGMIAAGITLAVVTVLSVEGAHLKDVFGFAALLKVIGSSGNG